MHNISHSFSLFNEISFRAHFFLPFSPAHACIKKNNGGIQMKYLFFLDDLFVI